VLGGNPKAFSRPVRFFLASLDDGQIMTTKLLFYFRVLFWVVVSFLPTLAIALQPPRPGEVEALKQQGKFEKQLKQAEAFGNHKFSKDLIQRQKWRLSKAAGIPDVEYAPPPAWTGGMPTSGSPKTLVLLIDFPDYPADANNTQSLVSSRFFTPDSASSSSDPLYPYESVRAFYERSSYGALHINGYVANWYRAQNVRSYYENLGNSYGHTALIDEALTVLANSGHNIAQYDGNGDGYIDSFYVKWTGPPESWAGFWWAYQSNYDGNGVFNGVRPRAYVWSWITTGGGSAVYEPQVDIHETGHLLGLIDYYDMDPSSGPQGGLGGLDMMDSNWGDHNSFSKFMLGWLTPEVLSSGSLTRPLLASGANADAVLVMPGASTGSLFSEYFLAQYRKRGVGNDPLGYPNDGVTVWHVNASLDSSGETFLYNNNFVSDHKLLRLVQADGLAQIEAGFGAWADEGDFFTEGSALRPGGNPSSNRYSGEQTTVTLDNIGQAGPTSITATFAVGDGFPSGGNLPVGYVTPSGSTAPWAVTNGDSYLGSQSLKSGIIGTGQRSDISYTANFSAGVVSFARKVSSESGYDFLSFSVDGVVLGAWAGEVAWSVVSFPLDSGTHTLLWTYAKDGDISSGSDAAWIDNVVISTNEASYTLSAIKEGAGTGTVNSYLAGSLLQCHLRRQLHAPPQWDFGHPHSHAQRWQQLWRLEWRRLLRHGHVYCDHEPGAKRQRQL